jgi:steroid delta-isomerase-like uncharacterized protein
MGANENLEAHRAWSDVENQYDFARLGEFLHPDIELHLPGGEIVAGLDAYRTMLESRNASFPDFHAENDDVFATNDRVVCRNRSTGTQKGEYFGFPPSGKRITFAGISLWEFDGGKARRGWAFPDVAAMLAQLSS